MQGLAHCFHGFRPERHNPLDPCLGPANSIDQLIISSTRHNGEPASRCSHPPLIPRRGHGPKRLRQLLNILRISGPLEEPLSVLQFHCLMGLSFPRSQKACRSRAVLHRASICRPVGVISRCPLITVIARLTRGLLGPLIFSAWFLFGSACTKPLKIIGPSRTARCDPTSLAKTSIT